jgi:hypothetical protein
MSAGTANEVACLKQGDAASIRMELQVSSVNKPQKVVYVQHASLMLSI